MQSNADAQPGTSVKAAKPARRYDIDWLRVLAVLLLFPFHHQRPGQHPGNCDVVCRRSRHHFDFWEGHFHPAEYLIGLPQVGSISVITVHWRIDHE